MSINKRVFVTQIPHTTKDDGGGRKVFVPTVNIGTASEFGEIVEMFPPRTSFNLSKELADQCWEKLSEFNPDIDYLLPMGDNFISATCCAILGKRFGYFNVLKWDKNLGRYLMNKVVI